MDRNQQYERTLRRLRQRVFDYPEIKQNQAVRCMHLLKKALAPKWQADAEPARQAREQRFLFRTM